METIIGNLPPWLVLTGSAIIGILAIVGVFDWRQKANGKEADKLEDRIKELYREQISEQDRKIETLQQDVVNLKQKTVKLETENVILKDLLQGRDTDSKEYRERAQKSMDLIEKLSEIAIINGKKSDAIMRVVEASSKNVERLAVAIEKHLK